MVTIYFVLLTFLNFNRNIFKIGLLFHKMAFSLFFYERKSYQHFAEPKKTSIFALPKSETRNNNAKYYKQ